MPITYLQSRTEPQLPVLGNIRKGSPKEGNRPGRDLDHFRFEPVDSGPAGLELLARWKQHFDPDGKGARSFLGFAVGHSIDEVMHAFMNEFAASGLKRRCTGPHGGHVVRELVGSQYVDYQPGEKPCLCQALIDAGKKPACALGVQIRLIIPQLGVAGICVLHTSSINDVVALDAQLKGISEIVNPPGDLSRIPLIFSRVQRKISEPNPDGGRKSRMRWMLQVQIAPAMMEGNMGQFLMAGRITRPQLVNTQARLVDKGTGEVLSTVAVDGIAGYDEEELLAEDGYVVEEEEDESPALPTETVRQIAGLTVKLWGAEADANIKQWVGALTKGRTEQVVQITEDEAARLLEKLNERIAQVAASADAAEPAKTK